MTASRVVAFEGELVEGWVRKAQRRIDGQVSDAVLAGGGRRFDVRTQLHTDVADAPYGRFMVAWPDGSLDPAISHLADSEFFLALLELAYADALAEEPGLRETLRDGSRLEIAITNDVLQVQAAGPPGRYGMIRHHALMHWAATAWLDDPASRRWFRLYEMLAQKASHDGQGRLTAEQLDAAEDEAFAVFDRLARATYDAEEARSLLGEVEQLRPVLTYLRHAAVAIAVLERSRQQSRGRSVEGFLSDQLVGGYREPEYLAQAWQRLLG